MKNLMTLVLLLFGTMAMANSGNEELLELKKKAAYYEIKVKLESGEITVKQAQKLWQDTVKKLREEAK